MYTGTIHKLWFFAEKAIKQKRKWQKNNDIENENIKSKKQRPNYFIGIQVANPIILGMICDDLWSIIL